MKNKILIVEHNLTDFQLIQDELKKGCVNYIAKMVQTENEYEKALHDFKPDIILSNYIFPNFDGATAFKLKKKLAPETPFIFVAKSIGEEKAVDLIKNGVTDFVLKERLGTLSAKINRALEENTETKKRLIDVKKIMDSSLDVICTSDEQGKFVHISAASESLWGYKPEELIGTYYMDLIFHGDIENTMNADANVKSGVPGTMFENRYIHKDGSIVPLLWSAKWDDKDKLMYRIAKDPTKVIKLEKAFKIERQRFHDLYLQAPSCMGILKGPNHIFEMANPLYLQLIAKKDIVGKTVKEVLPELESQGIFAFLDSVYQTGETFSANEILVKFDYHGNGKLVDTYLNFIYQAHRDMGNNMDGILFFANDVTEQVLSRKKIEESVLRYNCLIEQAGDAICFIDTSMQIIEVNHYACEMLGYSQAEISQLSIADFFLEEDLKINPMQMVALKKGKTVRNERRIKRKNDTLIDVELSAKMMNDGSFLIFLRDITEHKKAQQALIESERKYRQILETAQEGIWIIDKNHKTTFVNDKMCKILEYTQKEMIGKEIYSFMDEEGHQIAAKLMKRKKEDKSDKREFKYISKSGKEVWANVAANPYISETGEYKGSMAMVDDITEIKKTQQTHKESEKKYRYLFENNPMPMWIIDSNTFRFLDVNKIAVSQYGYSREEFLSMTAMDIRPEEDKERFIQTSTSFEDNGLDYIKEIWNHRKKDGTVIPVEIIGNKIIFEGSPARFILSNDISQQKKAQQALIENEKKYRQIVETAQEGIWLVDENQTTTFVNNKMAEILEYTQEEMIGKNIYFFMDDKGKQFVEKLLLRKEEKYSGQIRFKYISKSGKEAWAHISANPLFDDAGIYQGSLAMVTDITESKKAEQNFEQKNKELLKTNIELDRFVYSVSHDLRSPLTSILGLISFIEEESKEADTLEHVNMIRNSINRLDEFIKKILSYSRNNRTGLEIEKIPLQKTAIDIVDSLQSIKEAKGINFEIDIKEQHPFHSDKLRFNTILVNLISNAIKYHNDEKSNRYIKITGQSDHEILQITIADNGIGIAPAYHSKIFDMFFRLSGTKDGSGIGLYIVKDTLGILQGTIKIHSEEGVGTAFTITLKNLKK